MSIESDFEEISYGDAEGSSNEDDDDDGVVVVETSDSSTKSYPRNKNNSDSINNKVQVEIPKALLDHDPRKPSPKEPPSSEVSSLASSFVALMPALAVNSDHESQASVWTSVSSSNNRSEDDETNSKIASVQDWQEVSSVASSLKLNFELLNIQGSTIRKCKRCRRFNEDKTMWCSGCGIALVANPCPDMDLQIALNLKRKYEQEDLTFLRSYEENRKHLHQQPLLQRAQVLQEELHEFGLGICSDIYGSKCKLPFSNFQDTHGISFPNTRDLLFLVSSFIEKVDAASDEVAVAYTFVNNLDNDNVLKDGFPLAPKVSQNIEVARDSSANQIVGQIRLEPRCPSILGPIMEDQPKFFPVSLRGFIVAIINYSGARQRTVEAPSGRGTLVTLNSKDDVLPLASFDASSLNKDILCQLTNGYCRVLNDFFYAIPVTGNALLVNTTQDYSPTPAKKLKPAPSSSSSKNDDDSSVAHSVIAAFHGVTLDNSGDGADPLPIQGTFQDTTLPSEDAIPTKHVPGLSMINPQGSSSNVTIVNLPPDLTNTTDLERTSTMENNAPATHANPMGSSISAAETHQNRNSARETVPFGSHSELDVAFKNGKLFGETMGNAFYEILINENAPSFGIAADSTTRNEIVGNVIALLQQEEGKILNLAESGEWNVMSRAELFLQITRDLSDLDYQARSYDSPHRNNHASGARNLKGAPIAKFAFKRSDDWDSISC